MMQLVQFLINLPWTIFGLLNALISQPVEVEINLSRLTLIIWVKNIKFIPSEFFALTCGHVILIKMKARNQQRRWGYDAEKLKQHEFVHVKQFDRFWGFFPLIYSIESLLHGYNENHFELEAKKKS